MAKRFLTPINLLNLASDPATGSEGDIYFNTTDDVLKIYVNGVWTTLTGGGGGGAAINVSASAPTGAAEGDAWFDNTDGKFYVYDGTYWVETGQTDAVYSSYNRWTKVISASTVTISGLDDNSIALDYSPGLEQVYINGAFIDGSSYTATSGSSIVLNEAVYPTDLVEILWLENLVVSDTYSKSESDARYLSASTQFLNYWSEDNSGNFLPDIDNVYSIGASAARVKDLYLGASSLYIQSHSDPSQNMQISMGTGNKLNINGDELITLSTASSTYATKTELNNIDLSATINTASAAAYASASAYTDSAIASFEALPSQSGNAGKYLSTDGSTTSWATLDLNSAINTASAAAVTYLVDSAPATLDTLNELAQALGDDENFATTVTNSLAGKLDIATASTLYLPLSSSASFYRWTKNYSASASVISGNDDNLIPLSYNEGYIQLFINGVMLDPSEYTATDGSTITVNTPVLSGEVVDIFAFLNSTNVNTYSQAQIDSKYNQYTRWKKIYSASATVISGNDDNSLPLSYTSGYEQVYLNGILLTPITDYARTSSSVITLGQAVITNDVIEIINIQPFSVANVYTTSQADTLFEPNIEYVSSSPSGPSAGTLWIDSTNSAAPALKVYNGTTWIAVSGASEAGLHPFFTAGI